MKTLKFILIPLLSLLIFSTCNKDESIDTEKPEIDLSIQGAFPIGCDTIYFDEPFTLKALFRDNVELGSFSIDIHNNFDHHSHSTEVIECSLDPIKQAVNPFTLIQDYKIPASSKEYLTNLTITIPSSNSNGSSFDDGDYHFFISLTDKDGWSTQKGLSIKILHR
ncbi:MAG: DUF4625 domain-containing protein [Bacteroidales bacterium]|jgi:hypothetical protein